MLSLDPVASDPVAAKIEVANLLKRLGTDFLNIELRGQLAGSKQQSVVQSTNTKHAAGGNNLIYLQ